MFTGLVSDIATVERLEPRAGGVGIEDCQAVSRLVEPILDVEDFIEPAYDLEVLLSAEQIRARIAELLKRLESMKPPKSR